MCTVTMAFFVSVVFLLSEGLEGLAALVLLVALVLLFVCACVFGEKDVRFLFDSKYNEGREGWEERSSYLVSMVSWRWWFGGCSWGGGGKGGRERHEPRVMKAW